MQLTGKQIADNQIIFGYDANCIQQQGIDCRVIGIADVRGQGYIPREGKTRKCTTPSLPAWNLEGNNRGWDLEPGYYEVTFAEGCNIPANAAMYFKARSSIVRCGAEVHSGQFDGGFKTDHMGCFLEVRLPIVIELFAPIAQAIVNETYPVDENKLYNGQWQGDKQRN